MMGLLLLVDDDGEKERKQLIGSSYVMIKNRITKTDTTDLLCMSPVNHVRQYCRGQNQWLVKTQQIYTMDLLNARGLRSQKEGR